VDQAPAGLLRLNLETRTFHAAADEGWLALTQLDVSRSSYMRQLVMAYGFEAPLEAAFAYTPHLKLFVDLRKRSRAGLIASDLLTLGARANELSTLPACLIAPFCGPIEALGWMYVAERTTLLHERVRSNLLSRLPEAHDVVAYLSVYDGVVSARWNELGHVIDRVVRTEEHTDDLIAAARAGFRRLIDWSVQTQAYARGA
jgi:heme oxygenase